MLSNVFREICLRLFLFSGKRLFENICLKTDEAGEYITTMHFYNSEEEFQKSCAQFIEDYKLNK